MVRRRKSFMKKQNWRMTQIRVYETAEDAKTDQGGGLEVNKRALVENTEK